MENNPSKPNKGLVIISSYNPHSKTAYYAVYDLELKVYVIPYEFFDNVATSDNVIALLAICKAAECCVVNDFDKKIYCANDVSFGWAKKRCYKTKVTCRSILQLLEDSMRILRKHDFSNEITFWNPEWGTIRDTVRLLESDGEECDCPF